MNKQNVEVEGGELLLMSEEGHYAIIPAKHRREVEDMVNSGCDACINDYIKGLPKNEDYAEDGSLIVPNDDHDPTKDKTTKPTIPPNSKPYTFIDSADNEIYKAYSDSLNTYNNNKKYYDDGISNIEDKTVRAVLPSYDDLQKYKNKTYKPTSNISIDYTDNSIDIHKNDSQGYELSYVGFAVPEYTPLPKNRIFVKGTKEYDNAKTQEKLKELGFYKGNVDGIWGKKSQAALDERIELVKSLGKAHPSLENYYKHLEEVNKYNKADIVDNGDNRNYTLDYISHHPDQFKNASRGQKSVLSLYNLFREKYEAELKANNGVFEEHGAGYTIEDDDALHAYNRILQDMEFEHLTNHYADKHNRGKTYYEQDKKSAEDNIESDKRLIEMTDDPEEKAAFEKDLKEQQTNYNKLYVNKQDTEEDKPKELNFVKRMNDPNQKSIDNGDGTHSTHKMMSFESDGRQLAAPTIVEIDGKLVELEPKEAMDYALKTGEYKEFKTEKEAQKYAEGDYKLGTPMEKEYLQSKKSKPKDEMVIGVGVIDNKEHKIPSKLQEQIKNLRGGINNRKAKKLIYDYEQSNIK